jgi:hypothetical protein
VADFERGGERFAGPSDVTAQGALDQFGNYGNRVSPSCGVEQ